MGVVGLRGRGELGRRKIRHAASVSSVPGGRAAASSRGRATSCIKQGSRGPGTHHIVELDAVLEAELLKLLLRCTQAANVWCQGDGHARGW